jgi:hypothetical protein
VREKRRNLSGIGIGGDSIRFATQKPLHLSGNQIKDPVPGKFEREGWQSMEMLVVVEMKNDNGRHR